MLKNKSLLVAAVFAATAATAFAGRQGRVDLATMVTPLYTVEGDAFVRHNGPNYSNRSLYCSHIYAAAFGGDKPYCVLGSGDITLGSMTFALIGQGLPENKGLWLQNASDITSKYRPGRMEWIIKDDAQGGTTVHLEEVASAQGPGMVIHARVENARPGTSLLWASGGFIPAQKAARASRKALPSGHVLWSYDMISIKSQFIHRGFVPEDSQEERVEANGHAWTLRARDGRDDYQVTGLCSAPNAQVVVADASAWQDPENFRQSQGQAEPIACGTVPLVSNQDYYWTLSGPGVPAMAPAEAFKAAMQREEAIEQRVVVDTPDPWLNAAVGASSNVEDALFRDGIYSHSGMRWATALLGWRTTFGATAYGWHDNVKAEARTCIAQQITQSDNTAPHADPATRLSSQAPDSRMFGKGRVAIDHPHHYDMQSQFFDQLEHAWRWTGDPELEKLLRPALDLDCEYIKDCFDPAGLGIYESYANTWPTDDQWYNGGGTSEETAYAYRAERTALQFAQRAGDAAGVQLHTAAVARIKKGFSDLLWVPERGHPGAYREQAGLKRLHESCWLYGIFCPIDAGLLDEEQSAESLYYTEWGLERVKFPYGGEQCWPSNWVPSIWSVREMWAGDNYQLALAYWQTGLADDGWTVFRGTFPQQLLFGNTPGDLGAPAGGTDFNDCCSMFARGVVEGLFGYRPDYTNNCVELSPQFPSGWDHASITAPDVSISYHSSGTTVDFKVKLAKAAPLAIKLPVSTSAVQSVTVDGKPAKWGLLPGFGQSLVKIDVPSTDSATVTVTTQDTLKTFPAVHLSGNTGEPASLQAEGGKITDFHDPQGVLQDAKLEDGRITGVYTSNAGDHLVFGLATVGKTQQWREFKIHITDVKADEASTGKTVIPVPAGARWEPVSLDAALNGDIRTIYQQEYLSPRPNTCSLRLATNGYSSWQMSGGKEPLQSPPIDLNNVPSVSDGKGNVLAGDGVPFKWPAGAKNIAFTSSWDNWPHHIDVPVNKTGDAIWFLLCGTTNPMEVRIANAELRMKYADGVVEKLEIVPPFNFWTLCPFGGADYDYQRDGFSLPKTPPTTVQLGKNCRAVALGWRLRPGVALSSVTLETLSDEVIVGLMGMTLMNH